MLSLTADGTLEKWQEFF